jgi:hypothetical protein
VPELPLEQELEQLLAYRPPENSESFVINVMHEVRSKQRIRRMILWIFGGIGAVFGLASAIMLSGSIGRLFSSSVGLHPEETMQAVLFVVAAAAFYTWFMNDDMTVDSGF